MIIFQQKIEQISHERESEWCINEKMKIENVNDNVEVIVIPHNLDTPEFGVKAAHYIVDEMKKQGKFPQDFGEN